MATSFLNGEGVNVVWRYIALIMISANITAFTGYLSFGMDSVKHSEIDSIMASRAPYMHDKQRIEDRFIEIQRRLDKLEKQ